MILSVTLNPCIDQTLYVEGLAPHDTNRVTRAETDAGGKGVNLSRVAVEMGGDSLAIGFLGGGAGAYVRRVLDLQGVRHDFVEIAGDTRTNFSVEDGSGEPPTTFNAKGPSISPEEWDALLQKVREHSEGAGWVALGGSIPQGVPVEAYKLLGIAAKAAGAKLALDSDGEAMRRGLEAKPHLIKPNGPEAGRLLGRKVETVEEAVFAAEELRQYMDPDGVCVVSLGADGAVMSSQEGTYIGRPIAVEAKSTIGSGDSLVGAMLQALEQGAGLSEALRAGMAAGAATATTGGAEIASRSKVDELLASALVQAAH
ncbi:MAG: 1-phosphofructokinase family hexose kinase [Armatimonadetes bacterium]|nr:1-phosphofructokinase family hexose kinase [Armatimonadota bacterium]